MGTCKPHEMQPRESAVHPKGPLSDQIMLGTVEDRADQPWPFKLQKLHVLGLLVLQRDGQQRAMPPCTSCGVQCEHRSSHLPPAATLGSNAAATQNQQRFASQVAFGLKWWDCPCLANHTVTTPPSFGGPPPAPKAGHGLKRSTTHTNINQARALRAR